MIDLDCVGRSLDIPVSVNENIESHQHHGRALGEWYLNNHPCPSWHHVANALYEEREHGVLEVLKSRFLKGWVGLMLSDNS